MATATAERPTGHYRAYTLRPYPEKYAAGIIQKKTELMPPGCPLL